MLPLLGSLFLMAILSAGQYPGPDLCHDSSVSSIASYYFENRGLMYLVTKNGWWWTYHSASNDKHDRPYPFNARRLPHDFVRGDAAVVRNMADCGQQDSVLVFENNNGMTRIIAYDYHSANSLNWSNRVEDPLEDRFFREATGIDWSRPIDGIADFYATTFYIFQDNKYVVVDGGFDGDPCGNDYEINSHNSTIDDLQLPDQVDSIDDLFFSYVRRPALRAILYVLKGPVAYKIEMDMNAMISDRSRLRGNFTERVNVHNYIHQFEADENYCQGVTGLTSNTMATSTTIPSTTSTTMTTRMSVASTTVTTTARTSTTSTTPTTTRTSPTTRTTTVIALTRPSKTTIGFTTSTSQATSSTTTTTTSTASPSIDESTSMPEPTLPVPVPRVIPPTNLPQTSSEPSHSNETWTNQTLTTTISPYTSVVVPTATVTVSTDIDYEAPANFFNDMTPTFLLLAMLGGLVLLGIIVVTSVFLASKFRKHDNNLQEYEIKMSRREPPNYLSRQYKSSESFGPERSADSIRTPQKLKPIHSENDLNVERSSVLNQDARSGRQRH